MAEDDDTEEPSGEAELIAAMRRQLSATPPHVAEQLTDFSWSAVEALEFADYLLFPEKLHRRRKDGTLEQIPVMLRVPRGHELRKARALARAMCESDGVDPDREKDLLKDAEDVCILHVAMRTTTPPHEPLYGTPQELERLFDRRTLAAVLAKVDALIGLIDPRPETIDDKEMLAVVAAIAKERSIRPLVVFGSAAQRSYITTTAALLLNLLVQKSSPESSAPSTPGSST